MHSSFRRAVRIASLATTAMVVAATTHRLGAQVALEVNTDSAMAPMITPSIVVTDSVAAPVADVSMDAPVAIIGAPMTGLRAGVHQREAARPLVPTIQQGKRAGLGQAQALMIVGAAALVAGAIIGDDPGTIIMVGGAVIGLYGLYQYLQ